MTTWLSFSLTMKQAGVSSIDQGGGKRRSDVTDLANFFLRRRLEGAGGATPGSPA
jgi:hypothetical protein